MGKDFTGATGRPRGLRVGDNSSHHLVIHARGPGSMPGLHLKFLGGLKKFFPGLSRWRFKLVVGGLN